MNTGGPAFPAPEVGVQLHDYNGNVSGCRVFTPSQGMTLLDWMAGQALAGLCASPETQMPFDVMHRLAYGHAEAMLAEKARREEDHPEDKLGKDHSPDANKTVPSQSALIRSGWDLFTWADKTMDETDECRVFLHNWREAVRCQPEDHSPDAGKMTEINRELVEALELVEKAFCSCTYDRVAVRRSVNSALAKAKGVA